MSYWGGTGAQHLTRLCLATWGGTCHLCGQPGATTADHVIPRNRGGLNAIENLRPAHQGCNSARGDMDLAEWFRLHPLPTERIEPSRSWFG